MTDSSIDSIDGNIGWFVRPSKEEDAEAVNRLLHSSYSSLLAKDYNTALLDVALPRITMVRKELLTCGTWYVVEHPDHQTIVGCGGWTPKSPLQESIPHLRHFAVDPAFLRQGIAKELWNRSWRDLCEYFGTEQATEVYSTITAEPFYSSLGFKYVKRMTLPLGPGCDFPTILMRREIT